MAQPCATDIWNYTLGASSSPHSIGFGNPSTDTANQRLVLTGDDAVVRVPNNYGSTGGWVVTMPFTFSDLSNIVWHFGPQYNGSYTGYLPAMAYSIGGGIRFRGNRYSLNAGTFGSWNNFFVSTVAGVSGTLTVFYKAGTFEFAARATINGVDYDTGFVSIFTNFINRYTLTHFADPITLAANNLDGVYIYNNTYRTELTDDEVQFVYDGGALCGDLSDPAPSATTSSSPWIDNRDPHPDVQDATAPSLVTIGSDFSPGQNNVRQSGREAKSPKLNIQGSENAPNTQRETRTEEAKPVIHSIKKGYKDGFLSVLPEANGYNGALSYGTGNRIPIQSEDLSHNKEFKDRNCVSCGRQNRLRVSLWDDPGGSFTAPLRTNDLIPVLQSHFQKRIGTTPASGTTYYEFSPNRDSMVMAGSSFGTGSYNASGTYNPFTVSVYKQVDGSAYRFHHGLTDSIKFSFNADNEVAVKPKFVFTGVDMVGTNEGYPYGSLSSLPSFAGHQFTATFLNLPVVSLEVESNNYIKRLRPVGGTTVRHQFGRYQVKGQAVVDFSKDGIAYFGSMLGGFSFSLSGTLYGDERNKMVFEMPNCNLLPYELNLNNSTVRIPFSCYESEDGGTAPLTIKLWTRNYSGTTFEPN